MYAPSLAYESTDLFLLLGMIFLVAFVNLICAIPNHFILYLSLQIVSVIYNFSSRCYMLKLLCRVL